MGLRHRTPALLRQVDGKPYFRIIKNVKTTIDIPDALYKRAKVHAVETGRTLKDLVLNSLEKELAPVSSSSAPGQSFMERRKLRPEFQRLMESGAVGGGTDSTIIVSEDRSSREDALL